MCGFLWVVLQFMVPHIFLKMERLFFFAYKLYMCFQKTVAYRSYCFYISSSNWCKNDVFPRCVHVRAQIFLSPIAGCTSRKDVWQTQGGKTKEKFTFDFYNAVGYCLGFLILSFFSVWFRSILARMQTPIKSSPDSTTGSDLNKEYTLS